MLSQIWVHKADVKIKRVNYPTFVVLDSSRVIAADEYERNWLINQNGGVIKEVLPDTGYYLIFQPLANGRINIVQNSKLVSRILQADFNFQDIDTLLTKQHYLTNVGGNKDHILAVGSVEMGFPVDELHHFSFDEGKTWRIDTMKSFRSACIAYLSAERWLCGTARGVIAQTLDSGKSWTRYQTPSVSIIKSIRVFGDTVFVESNSERFYSVDSLTTWIELTNKPETLLSRICDIGENGSIVGTTDSIYYSDNHGLTFKGEPVAGTTKYYNFLTACSPNDDCFAIVYNYNKVSLLKRETTTTSVEGESITGITCSPNPSDLYITLELNPTDGTTPLELSLYNPTGIKFDKSQFLHFDSLPKGRHTVTIPVQDIPSGYYMIQVRNNKSQYHLPCLIVH